MFSVSYLTGLLFSLMPVRWVSWMSEGLQTAIVMMAIAAELLLGILLWKGIRLSKALTGATVF